MQNLLLLITILLLLPLHGQELTWVTINKSPKFEAAQLDLEGNQPRQAIVKLKDLLTEKLDSEARNKLLQTLGEAQVRAGLAEQALPNLNSESPLALQWRSYALIQLGRFREAEKVLAQIEGNQAVRQRALILNSLEQHQEALKLLTPIMQSSPETQLQAISVHLDLGQLDEAETLLKEFSPPETAIPQKQFLNGRLQYARGSRLAAMETFKSLTEPTTESQTLTPDINEAAIIFLVDSAALDGNEKTAVEVAIDYISKNPKSQRLSDLFLRLVNWIEFVPEDVLKSWIEVSDPKTRVLVSDFQNLAPPAIPAPHVSWALYLQGLKRLAGKEPDFARASFARLFAIISNDLPKLRQRALISLGLHHLENKRAEEALDYFNILLSEASPGEMKAVASSLKGTAAFALQDPKQAAAAFSEASTIAKKLGLETLAKASSLNAALSQLQAGLNSGQKESTLIPSPILQLERGLLFANQNDPRARAYLADFVTRFTQHPRLNEARLALAESAVFTSPQDPELAITQLDQLNFGPNELDFQIREISALLKLACLIGKKVGVEDAEKFLSKYPKHPAAGEILFRMGRAFTCCNESPQAYVIYERLLNAFPESELADSARMLSAQAAFSVGNEAAEKRAFTRYEELIQSSSTLATEAALERAGLRLDRGEFVLALNELQPLLNKENLTISDQRRILVLAAKAASNADQGDQALIYYDLILTSPDLPSIWFNQANFLKGQLLETLNRHQEALESYNKVIYRNLDPEKSSELEWKFHDKAALEGALPLLERLGNWEGAYHTALRVSKSGGPSAERSAQRAKKIQLDKQLFDITR